MIGMKTTRFAPTEKKYPETLSAYEIDDIKWKIAKDFGSLKRARAYAKKISGQLYTQVDAGMERVYVKGSAIVNRTGRWMVVKT